MKTFIAVPALLALVSLASLATTAAAAEKEVSIPITDVFLPEVAERNTDVKAVLIGMFPNSCYRWSQAVVTETNEMVHQINAKALVTTETMCLMMLVPYHKEINLGRLEPGEHSFRIINADDTFFEKKLTVK